MTACVKSLFDQVLEATVDVVPSAAFTAWITREESLVKVVARYVASLSVIAFGVGGAVGLGAALIDSSPAGAVTSITVNDANDPASPNLGNCLTTPETDCSLRAALDAAAEEGGVVDISLPDPSTVHNNPTAPGGA